MGSYGPFWDGPTVPLEVESALDPPSRLSPAWLLAGAGLAGALLLAGAALAAVDAIGPPRPDSAISVVAPAASTPPGHPPEAASPAGPVPSSRPAPPSHGSDRTCGAPANPWGFTLCDRGTAIHRADLPARVCDYFACTHNFRAGRGAMVECVDGEYSMTGGLPHACAGHAGVHRRVRAG